MSVVFAVLAASLAAGALAMAFVAALLPCSSGLSRRFARQPAMAPVKRAKPVDDRCPHLAEVGAPTVWRRKRGSLGCCVVGTVFPRTVRTWSTNPCKVVLEDPSGASWPFGLFRCLPTPGVRSQLRAGAIEKEETRTPAKRSVKVSGNLAAMLQGFDVVGCGQTRPDARR